MAVYAVQREDAVTHDARLMNLPGAVADSYVFQYKMKAGELVVPPYPLNLIVGLDPCINTVPDLYSTVNRVPNGSYFSDGIIAQRTWFVDHKGNAWAVSGGSYLTAHYFYKLAPDFWYPTKTGSGASETVVGTASSCRNSISPPHLRACLIPRLKLGRVPFPCDSIPLGPTICRS